MLCTNVYNKKSESLDSIVFSGTFYRTFFYFWFHFSSFVCTIFFTQNLFNISLIRDSQITTKLLREYIQRVLHASISLYIMYRCTRRLQLVLIVWSTVNIECYFTLDTKRYWQARWNESNLHAILEQKPVIIVMYIIADHVFVNFHAIMI